MTLILYLLSFYCSTSTCNFKEKRRETNHSYNELKSLRQQMVIVLNKNSKTLYGNLFSQHSSSLSQNTNLFKIFTDLSLFLFLSVGFLIILPL
ncbi:hypothetical protein ACJW30_10G035800 [Castanea mollissima]